MIASTDVDKTGASYYGEQTLHYIATNGESAVVQLREYFSGLPFMKNKDSKKLWYNLNSWSGDKTHVSYNF